MKKEFGYFDFMLYDDSNECFDDYRHLINKIPKEKVIEHIESLTPWRTSIPGRDPFTGETLYSGLYEDGDFIFPLDFLHYYKNYDIGIPYDYEAYLMEILD